MALQRQAMLVHSLWREQLSKFLELTDRNASVEIPVELVGLSHQFLVVEQVLEQQNVDLLKRLEVLADELKLARSLFRSWLIQLINTKFVGPWFLIVRNQRIRTRAMER